VWRRRRSEGLAVRNQAGDCYRGARQGEHGLNKKPVNQNRAATRQRKDMLHIELKGLSAKGWSRKTEEVQTPGLTSKCMTVTISPAQTRRGLGKTWMSVFETVCFEEPVVHQVETSGIFGARHANLRSPAWQVTIPCCEVQLDLTETL
jgi:hypothetical protein